jgi:hypothetical protein
MDFIYTHFSSLPLSPSFFLNFLKNYSRNISSETAAILAVLWAKINQLVWGTNQQQKNPGSLLGFIVFGYFVSAGPLEEERREWW